MVAALGIDPWIVILFEAGLNASAVYTHGNVRLPQGWTRPALGFLHARHAPRPPLDDPEETNSNFGFFLSVWDRACGTMRQSPAKGQQASSSALPSIAIRPGSGFWRYPADAVSLDRARLPVHAGGKSEIA